MAVLVRTRRLANPARRRAKRRVNAGKKRMTLKQKLHFGTARQRAVARLSLRGRKVNPSIRRVKNGSRKRVAKGTARYAKTLRYKKTSKGFYKNPRRRKRRKNIGEIVSISLAGLNPGRKRRRNTGMAKRRRRARRVVAHRRRRRVMNPAPRRRRRTRRVSSHRRRRNPVMRMRINPRRRRRSAVRRVHHRRRNPGIGGVSTGIVYKALGVIGGAIGSKYVTQLALGGNNTGYMGYAGNLVASIALGWAAGKVTKNKELGTMVVIGGVAALTLRVLQDMTPLGNYVNLSLAGVGKGGDLGLGIIQDSSFPVPQVAVPGSMTKFITPRNTRDYVSAQTAQMAAASGSKAGMGRMMGRSPRAARAIM